MLYFFLKEKKIPALLTIICIAFLQRGMTLWVDFYDIDEASEIIASRQIISGTHLSALLERPLSFIFLVFKLFESSSNHDVLILRLATILWILANAFLLFKINTLLFNKPSGYFAALFYVIFVSSFFEYYLSVHGEIVFNPIVSLGFYLFILAEKSHKTLYYILTAITASFAFLIKGQTLVFLAVILTHLLLIKPLVFKHKLSINIRLSTWILSVFVCTLLVLFSLYYFLGMLIHIKHYFMSNFLYTIYGFFYPNSFQTVVTQNPWLSILTGLFKTILIIAENTIAQFPLWLAFAFFLKKNKPFSFHNKNPYLILLLLFLFFSFLAIFMGGLRLYDHYFIQYLPALCLIAGLGLYQYLTLTPSKKRNNLAHILLLFPILLYSSWNYTSAYFYRHNPQKVRFKKTPHYTDIIQWIQNNTQASDKIAVWGPSIRIYWFSKRQPAFRLLWSERYMFAYHITKNIFDHPIPSFKPEKLQAILKLHPLQQWSWASPENILYSIILDIYKNKPSLIVDTSNNQVQSFQNSLLNLPIVSEYLQQYYYKKQTIHKVKIYARRNLIGDAF